VDKELELWWAERAHRILTDTKHWATTNFHSGSPQHPAVDDPDLRYAGYLGPRYRPGYSVLAIGNVHTSFRTHQFAEGASGYRPELGVAVDQALQGTRLLKEAVDVEPIASRYFELVRPLYEYGLSGSWALGTRFRPAFEAVGIGTRPEDVEELAYVNASCSQLPEGRDLTDGVFSDCLAVHPLVDLVKELDPIAIVTCSERAYDRLYESGVTDTVTTLCFSQHLNSPHLARAVWLENKQMLPGRSMSWKKWAPSLKAHVESLRAKRFPAHFSA
jgi:hypothetical protein